MDLSKYYANICKVPLLSKTEEIELFNEYYNPDTNDDRKAKIRDRIIQANLRFAFKQAKYYSAGDIPMFIELISAGNEGLLVAFDKYDLSKDCRFLTYAGWWVKQRILNEMTKMRIVSLPIQKQQLSTKIERLRDENEKITLSEVEKALVSDKVRKEDVREMYGARYLTFYIDDLEEHNFAIDPISDNVQQKMDRDRIWKAVNSLPSPQREIIARCYGLEDDSEHSISEMSKALRMPKDTIQKHRAEGLQKLREILEIKKPVPTQAVLAN